MSTETLMKPKYVDWREWQPSPDNPGYVRVKRYKTIDEYVKEVLAAFSDLYPESKRVSCHGAFEYLGILVILKYQSWHGWSKESEIPGIAHIFTHCEQGSCEGCLVSVRLECEKREPIDIITGKCFDQDFAWQACRQLAEIVGAM